MPPDEPLETPEPPNWEPVAAPRSVFRFLRQPDRDADDFADNFRPDSESPKKAAPGEHPELRTGMSAFVSEAKARERWAQLKAGALKQRSEKNARRQSANPRRFRMSVGDYIGEIILGPGAGIEIVDPGEPDGHLTIRAPKEVLAARVADVYPAETKPT
jgi:hypothetical protein